MNPFLPSEHSGSVKPLPATRWTVMHSHENEVYFRFVPGNLQAWQSFLHHGKGIQSDIVGDSIAGSSQVSGLNLWRKRLNEMLHIHFGHSSVGKQSGSGVRLSKNLSLFTINLFITFPLFY